MDPQNSHAACFLIRMTYLDFTHITGVTDTTIGLGTDSMSMIWEPVSQP